MIIGIDARVLEEGNGGIFTYTKNLLEKLAPLAPTHQLKLFLNRRSAAASPAIDKLKQHPNVKLYRYRFPNKFLNASFRFRAWPAIDKLIDGCDVLWFPTMMYGAWSAATKTVLTMHDLSFEIFSEYFTFRQQLWHFLLRPRRLGERVDKLIAVSRHTAGDLQNLWQMPAEKITVIHSGVGSELRPIMDQSLLQAARARYNLPPAKYILQVGAIEPRKNAILTLAAFAKWRAEYPSESGAYRLLFAGHRGWRHRQFYKMLALSPLRNQVHFIYNYEAQHLPALYNLASLCVYPSFYEGFGLPPLEAMAAGVPVIAAADSSLGEVVGDAGLLIDPYRVDDMVNAIRALVNDEKFYKTLRGRGIARTLEFSWDKTAKETLKVLENV